MRADGILFDKDGTLFDFRATWCVWAGGAIRAIADGDDALATRIANELEFDLETESFLPQSILIAGTNREAAEAVARVLPGWDVDEIEVKLMQDAAEAPVVPAVELAPYLENLSALGLRLGVMTNDTEFGARVQLRSAGVETHFDFIAGFDSGFGAKPDPEPLLAFADALQLDPTRVVMVGDSTHDLIAGRRAGMQTVAVLTGIAKTEELAPHADIVMENIGHLPGWLRA